MIVRGIIIEISIIFLQRSVPIIAKERAIEKIQLLFLSMRSNYFTLYMVLISSVVKALL